MVDLIHLGMFAVIFLALMGFVSNTSVASQNNIADQMFLMNCPLPIYNGIPTLHTIEGFAINYTVSYTNATDGQGASFECLADGGSTTFFAQRIVKDYGQTLFDFIPIGFLAYLSDSITTLFQRVQSMFTLISYFVTPTNFNILGYTLADLGTFALLIVIIIYAICYIVVGIMLYKVISPFSGAG